MTTINRSIFRKELGEIATNLARLNLAVHGMGMPAPDRDHLDYLLASCAYFADQANAMAGKLLVAELTDKDREQAAEAGRRA
jgi:hypothetical protein